MSQKIDEIALEPGGIMKNAKMDDYNEVSYKSYIGGLKVFVREKDPDVDYEEIRGVVEHSLGIVAFVQFKWAGDSGRRLQLNLIHEGKDYVRTWKAFYGEKTIARLANNFIEEIKGK